MKPHEKTGTGTPEKPVRIIGTKKCSATRKAERFFKERKIPMQFHDCLEKPLSPGEIANIRSASGGVSLIDTRSKEYQKRGMAHMDFDEDEELPGHPGLLLTPIVRRDRLCVIGEDPEGWKKFL